jgi:hypothetical protein
VSDFRDDCRHSARRGVHGSPALVAAVAPWLHLASALWCSARWLSLLAGSASPFTFPFVQVEAQSKRQSFVVTLADALATKGQVLIPFILGYFSHRAPVELASHHTFTSSPQLVAVSEHGRCVQQRLESVHTYQLV